MSSQKSILFLLYTIVFILCFVNQCTSISDSYSTTFKNNTQITYGHHKQYRDDFLIIDHLSDNERETRIKWKDLMGKETTLDMENNERFVNSSLKLTSLWQLTDGKDFAQLIFKGNGLIDCEYISGNENAIVGEFVEKFIEEYHFMSHEKLSITKHAKKYHKYQYEEMANLNDEVLKMKSNVKFIQLKKSQDIPEHLLRLMNLKKLKKQCNRLHNQIRQKLQLQNQQHMLKENEEDSNTKMNFDENTIQRIKRQTDSWFLAPNSKWCGSGSSANGYKELGASTAEKCCRRHDICKVNIPPLQKRYNLFNIRPFTISACRCDRRRSKRDLPNLLIIPYTKYCGIGWTAKKYSEIGAFSRTDKCCRTHDYCTHYIGSFEQKWGLFNWSINTIMRCKCDERFRTCLKIADTNDSHLVGKLFFNIIQTKCFVLKSVQECILFSWWGKCLKYKTRKQAYLRDNPKY